MTKRPEEHLPAKAPKRTGKKGIGPKPDPEEVKRKPELLSEANKQRGKTSRLPGMEDPEIEELEDAAREYANLRDDRMHLTTEEVKAQATLLGLMKKHKKEVYKHDNVEVRVVIEKEKVKVKIKKDKDD